MSPVARLLAERIRAQGPVSVAEFMDLALAHPRYGYYRRQDPLGAAGDFITAPEISQMFGELIGLWSAVAWQAMGSPAAVVLAELGPGRGTLMADLLRAAAMVPGFRAALRLHLVETSPALRRRQRQALAGETVRWHERFDQLPPGPLLLVANELFDALPIEQYQYDPAMGWRRRLVGLGAGEGAFAFVAGPPAIPDMPPDLLAAAGPGDLAETCPAGRALAGAIGRRLAADGGAALIIDYGPAASDLGESLQAVRHHAYHPVLAAPGEADLTAHVDFAALAAAATAAGARAHGPVPQGRWLRRLGIERRAAILAGAAPERAATIAGQCRRLIEPAEMGTLFKVLAVTHPAMAIPPGFLDEQVPPA